MTDLPDDNMKKWVLIFPSFYILALVILLLYRGAFKHLYPLEGMPFTVPWFGALGGVIASLEGIFLHNQNWEDKYKYWHMFSGIVGSAFGLFSYLFIIVVVKTSGASMGSNHSSLIFPLAAFVLGFSQQDFPKLLRRATAVIFGPGEEQGQKSKVNQNQN